MSPTLTQLTRHAAAKQQKDSPQAASQSVSDRPWLCPRTLQYAADEVAKLAAHLRNSRQKLIGNPDLGSYEQSVGCDIAEKMLREEAIMALKLMEVQANARSE